MQTVIYALVVCATSFACRIPNGRPDDVYFRSQAVCDRTVANYNAGTMGTSTLPEGHPERLWYECWHKTVPAWERN